MNITGIIAEYNPFHNGHLYHLTEARQTTGADYTIAVMSGNFLQRGTPAFVNKYQRTLMALENGVDLVLELPTCYACNSAEYFAAGSVALLDCLGITNNLVFGSEAGALPILQQIAKVFLDEPPAYASQLKAGLRSGLSFPKARAAACSDYLAQLTGSSTSIGQLLNSPNNILSIEYLKILQKRNSSICPVTILRKSAGYHDQQLGDEISSATAIRQHIEGGGIPKQISSSVPPSVYSILSNCYGTSCPINENHFSAMLHYRLLTEEGFTRYQGVNQELNNKILKNREQFSSFSQFCSDLKSREITYTAISRAMMHILLGITKEEMNLMQNDACLYARILGFRKDSTPLLKALKENSSIPLLTKMADYKKLLSSSAQKLLEIDVQASHIYEAGVFHQFHQKRIHEFQQSPIML